MTITTDSINTVFKDYPAIIDGLMTAATHLANYRQKMNDLYVSNPSASAEYFSAQDVADEVCTELRNNADFYTAIQALPGDGCGISRLANLLKIPAPTGEDYTCAWVDCTTCNKVVLSPAILALSSDIFRRDITD